jgi:hypothetical protein
MGILAYGLALSMHAGLTGDYKEVHPYVNYSSNNVHVGAYYNSESNVSPYIHYRLENDSGYFLDLGIVGGYNSFDVLPLARAGKHFKGAPASLFVSPAYELTPNGNNFGAIVGIQFKF